MTIELSPSDCWVELVSITDVKMYLLFCNAGGHRNWRVPTVLELRLFFYRELPWGLKWYAADMTDESTFQYYKLLIPVRDIY